MIFLTVGSDNPFPRLTKAFDKWCEDHPGVEAFAQIGHVKRPEDAPQSVPWTEVLPADEFNEMFDKARVIVAHAGMGSIITALSLRKPVVMLTRLQHLMEQRSDHQVATAERFKDRPGIFVAKDEHDLEAQISKAQEFKADDTQVPLARFAPDDFTSRLRAFILHGKTAN